MTFLELKPLTAQLLPAVVELDRVCFGGLWTREGYQRELDSPNSDLLVLSLPQSDESLTKTSALVSHSEPLVGVGCLWAILDEAHITLVGVHPNYQGKGLGQSILYGLLSSAAGRGLERATLEVRASNQVALSLYQKFGFRVAGRRRHYYPDDEDALILWRSDLQHPKFQQTLADWKRQIGDRLALYGWNLSMNPAIFPQTT